MDPHTLPLYGMAGGLSLSLGLFLLIFAHFQSSTLLIRYCAVGILVLAAGFVLSGIGPLLPRWGTVVGTNMMLLAAGVLFHSGMRAWVTGQPPGVDRFGWGLVAFSALPFAYWGLVEPDGHYRSVVFSFVLIAVNGRTAWMLLHQARRRAELPLVFLAILFGVLTVWMLTRGVWLLLEPAPPQQRGVNPTQWISVFGYIILVSMMVGAILWLEVAAPRDRSGEALGRCDGPSTGNAQMTLLWGTVALFMVATVSGMAAFYRGVLAEETDRAAHETQVATDSFVEHTRQVAGQTHVRAMGRLRDIVFVGLSANALNILFALVLTLSIRQRETMGRYLQTLREQHERNSALFDATQEGVVLVGDQGPMECNPGILRIYGATSKEEFLALRAWSPAVAPPVQPCGTETRVYVQHHLALAREKVVHRFEVLQKRMDTGETFPADIMLTAVRLGGKGIIQGVVRDITERVRHERELQQANDALSQRNEEQDRFLSMLNHELKTPLSVIKLSLGSDARLAANRERIIRNVAAIETVIERCLQTDRLRHGRIVARPAPCDIHELLVKLVTESREPERIELDPALFPPRIETDAMLLRIVLGNLLDNALKYSEPASLVRVRVADEVAAGREGVRIAVGNVPGGAGMPDMDQVFSKFYRAPGARGKTGSGLGLHIAEGVARILGGRLDYQPEPNTVRFILWIPR